MDLGNLVRRNWENTCVGWSDSRIQGFVKESTPDVREIDEIVVNVD